MPGVVEISQDNLCGSKSKFGGASKIVDRIRNAARSPAPLQSIHSFFKQLRRIFSERSRLCISAQASERQ